MLNTSFAPWPSFSEEEVEAVSRVLRSNRVNYWTGEEGRLFEREFAAWSGTEFSIALANGTVALEIALRALEVGPGDEVIVTPRSFMASASCVVALGATPVFAEIDRETQNLTAATIAERITSRTKAIIPVHLGGSPCDMDPIMALAGQHGIFVIEDCAQAHGARYKGRPVGSIGHIGSWSFCQDKIITTGGEGGMITTSDEDLWNRMWSYKDHGKNQAAMKVHEPQATFRWVHDTFGTNARMLEMQAVIGRLQLKRMPEWSAARRRNSETIWRAARGLNGVRVPDVPQWAEHACYRCYVFVEPQALAAGWTRDRIIHEIRAKDVPCFVGSCSEIYLEKAFDGTPWRPAERLPIARELGETSLAFLVHPSLAPEHVEKTCEVLREVMRQATT